MTPIAETAARLGALDPLAGFAVAGDAGGEVGGQLGAGWVALADAERDGHLDAWLAGFVAMHGRRAVAGSAVGTELTGAVIGPTVAALVLDRRCPDPSADNLAVWPDGYGYLERRAFRRPTAAMLPGDSGAGDPASVVLDDEAALDRWWAGRTATTLGPLLAAVRARAPFGVRALWGGVSDEVSRIALRVARLAGRDPERAWWRAQRLLDALAPHAPVALTRARPFPVGERLFQVRGTCCLYYRSAAAVDDGPPGDRYCSTCPLRDDGSRRRLLHDVE